MAENYDSVLIVSFGGPEGPDDVEPFLANVTAGRDIPAARLAAVAAQYQHFGGVSPINSQCRRLRDRLAARLSAAGLDLPVYWGNRNWAPYLADTVAEMAAAGHRRALAVVTSAYSSYSGCRQYLDDIAAARAAAGDAAPVIDKVRPYFDHPGFVDPFADAVAGAAATLGEALRPDARLVFTAHSIPVSMAAGCAYERQLAETARLVAGRAGFDDWTMAWQSRSGPPSVPWLEPDINDCLTELARQGTAAAVLAPIGFVSDHMEVMWDLDVTAAATAQATGYAPGARQRPRHRTRRALRRHVAGTDRGAPRSRQTPPIAQPARPDPDACPGCCPRTCCPMRHQALTPPTDGAARCAKERCPRVETDRTPELEPLLRSGRSPSQTGFAGSALAGRLPSANRRGTPTPPSLGQ